MNTSKLERYNLKQYTRLVIAFFACLLLLTVFQYAVLFYKGVVDTIATTSFLIAIAHQLGYASLIGLVLVFVFNFWENLRPRYGFNLVFVILALLLLLEAMLVSYYCQVMVPLGSDLLGYSFADIKETISNSGGMSIGILVGVVLIIGIFLSVYRLTSRYYHHIANMFPFTIVLFSFFLATYFLEGKPINQNKTQYLAVNLYTTSTEDNTYNSDEEYPLIKSNLTNDVLGEHFNLKEEKPNIVVLIVEGLGRDFVGEGAEYGGFTPFLDSLSTKSLYWENCLSNTGRTFGILPSLLGSLPFGQSGFMELDEMPNKLTLFTILKNNGYRTSLYQGTNSSFDNVDKFLLSEDVDFVLDKSGFGKDYEMQQANDGGFSWGYPDKELFRKGLSLKPDSDQNQFEVYLTITTHEPFVPPNEEFYDQKATEVLANLNLDKGTKKVMEKNKNIFATLLYTDEAISFFFKEYSKKPSYDNTIFLITGDHRLIPIPMRNRISRFHVPLIMYSPMLKNARKIKGLTSHFDVAPSLLALLEGNYEMKTPKKVAWLGSELEMSTSFRATKNIPLMRNKNDLRDYVSGDKFLSNNSVYSIESDLSLSSTLGGSDIEDKLQQFKSINDYVTTQNKIIPDSLAIFTLKKEKFSKTEMVWLNSLFNEYHSDKLFRTAQKLAFNKDYDKALLLSRFILSETPGHIDTKILMGRVNAWRGERELAIKILQECINMNPDYIDSYSALFDVYFWDDRPLEALELIELVHQQSSDAEFITDKIERARNEARKKGVRLPEKIEEQKTVADITYEE